MPDPSPNPNPNQALDAGLYHIKSNRAKARVKEDEKRIKRFIEAREGGYAAFDKLVIAMVMNVVDATKWALRCKECHNQASRRRHTRSPLPPATPHPTPPRHLPPSHRPQASLTRVLEEALPLFIARKQAFHLLLKQVGSPYNLNPITLTLTLTLTPTLTRWVRSSRLSCCGGHSRTPCRASLARRRGSSSTPPHSAAATRCSTWRPSPCVVSS